jgi:hypothetical protein
MINDVLRNINLFVDGVGQAGAVEELVPPKLTMLTESMRAGGMDAALDIEMGMESLEASFTLVKYSADVLKLMGLAPGNNKPFTFRGSTISEDGTEKPVVIQMQGMLKETDPGTWKPGEAAKLKGTVSIRYYKQTIDNEVIHEIDIPNMKRIINGVDQLAQTRKNLGM